jgi:ubiquinone/menaquinone biosynthesis C-methylase UbiE
MDYNKCTDTYDSFRYTRKSIVDFIVAKIKDNNYYSILDFGCGTGNYIYEINNKIQGLCLIGLDPSESMREIACKKNPKVAIIEGNNVSIPLDSNSVEMIFMVNVIHHIDNIEKMFFEFNRVLKKYGNILIITESHRQIQDKTWLSYFDEAKNIDLERFHDISKIVEKANIIGLDCYEESVIDDIPYDMPIDEFIDLINNKVFSILHLISDKSFRSGLQSLKNDSLVERYILRHNAKTILCFKKHE